MRRPPPRRPRERPDDSTGTAGAGPRAIIAAVGFADFPEGPRTSAPWWAHQTRAKALGFRALDMSHVAKACREISRSAWRSSCAQDASNLWSLMNCSRSRVKGSSGCFCGGFCGAGAGAAHFGGEGAAAAAAKDPARGFGSGGGRAPPFTRGALKDDGAANGKTAPSSPSRSSASAERCGWGVAFKPSAPSPGSSAPKSAGSSPLKPRDRGGGCTGGASSNKDRRPPPKKKASCAGGAKPGGGGGGGGAGAGAGGAGGRSAATILPAWAGRRPMSVKSRSEQSFKVPRSRTSPCLNVSPQAAVKPSLSKSFVTSGCRLLVVCKGTVGGDVGGFGGVSK